VFFLLNFASMADSQQSWIGFPVPLLGEAPVRLRVIHDDGDCFALEKPAGIQVLQDNWYPRLPSLTEALNLQAAKGKPELGRLGIGAGGAFAVYMIDPFISGPVLYTRREDTAVRLRNDWGSGAFRFTFHLVASAAPTVPEVHCDLPIARHAQRARSLVSHTTGKKASTTFRCLRRLGRYSLWEAVTSFARPHQILLHAHECGIAVSGDMLYAKSPALRLADIKRDFRPGRSNPELPLYDAPAVHLCAVAIDAQTTLHCEAPSRFSVLVRQLGRYAR